jgi:protein tyrosine/serine phosphatase
MRLARTGPVVLVALLLAPGLARAQTPAPPLATPRNDVKGLKNLARIAPGLWRSQQPTKVGFREARRLGIKTVINLRALNSDRRKLRGSGLDYVHLRVAPWNPKREQVLAFLKVATDPRYQPVLVHCQHGADRTGLMIASYRVHAQGWTKERAMQELKSFGFHAIWNNLKTYFLGLDFDAIKRELPGFPMPKVERIH